jgi:non-ribosomal peptide synthetase component F
MIVGLLGIIKAGGAYLPLSPNYPDDRLIYMIKDSNIQFMISQEDLVERLPGIINKVLCLDREWENILEETDNNPACVVSPHNLVYVLALMHLAKKYTLHC